MTLPLLLLGLYVGLLVFAVLLSGWAGHSVIPQDSARRVTDAAERAALGHLVAPVKLATLAAITLSVLSGTVAALTGLDIIWFFLTPLIAPIPVGAALFLSARKALRTSGKLVGVAQKDQRISLIARTALSGVLLCEVTVALVLLGTFSLASRIMAASDARFLVYLAGSSVGLFGVVVARATASAHYATSENTVNLTEGPHAASLAQLVAATFHAPLLRLSGLVVLTTLGHCGLLSVDNVLSEPLDGIWLYPHLLKLLGLIGLLFAGLVVRASEDESLGEGWIRGAFVYVVLMIAGAWSLSSQLPAGWAHTVPSGLSFLYGALALSLWIARRDDPAQERSAFQHAFLKMPASLLFFGLLLVLMLSATLPHSDTASSSPLPSSALMSLLLAGALAAAPLGFMWLLGRDLSGSSQQAAQLAYVGQDARLHVATYPSARLLFAVPLLAVMVALTALSEGLLMHGEPDGLMLTLFGIGTCAGALLLVALSGQLERATVKSSDEIVRLVQGQGATNVEPAPLNFEAAVVLCRDAISRSDRSWLLLALIPSSLALLIRPFVAAPFFQSLAFGLGVGSVLSGIGLELLFSGDVRSPRRSLAHLSFVVCLSQSIWLLAAGSAPSWASS